LLLIPACSGNQARASDEGRTKGCSISADVFLMSRFLNRQPESRRTIVSPARPLVENAVDFGIDSNVSLSLSLSPCLSLSLRMHRRRTLTPACRPRCSVINARINGQSRYEARATQNACVPQLAGRHANRELQNSMARDLSATSSLRSCESRTAL